jgi:predicted ATPase
LLAKDPADRFQTALSAKEALQRLAQGEAEPRFETAPTKLIELITRARVPSREREWEKLRECWAQSQVGLREARPVVILAGEAGSGKGQLVHQLREEAQQSGGLALSAQCYAQNMTLPHQPISDMLRDALRETRPALSPSMAADFAKLIPEIAENYPLEKLPPLSAEAERLRLHEHLTQFLLRLAEAQPLLIAIEYLHHADENTLAFIQYLARRVRGARLLILGTYRPSELDYRHPFEALLHDLLAQDLVTRLALNLLSSEEIATFGASALGARLNPALVQAIYEKTQGNLFFTKELLKSLLSEGKLHWDEQRREWRAQQLDRIQLPSSVRSVLGLRLSQLSPSALQHLATAALIGTRFRFKTLQAVTESEEEALVASLEEGLRAKFIEEEQGVRDESYRFVSQTLIQSLLDTLNHRTRARLHLKVAKVLEAQHAHQSASYLEAIARHYSLGARTDEDVQQALDYLSRAAKQAAESFALSNALDLYNLALDLIQDDPRPDREPRLLALYRQRGLVHQQRGDFSAAATDLERVAESSIVNEDPRQKRGVLLQLGQVYRRGEQMDAAIRVLREAVQISRTLNEPALLADALYFLGAAYWSFGRIRQALNHQEEGLALVRAAGLKDEVAMRVIHGLAECYGRLGEYERLFTLAEESLHMARDEGDLEYQSENLAILSLAQINRGDYERAQALLEQDYEICRQAGLGWHQAINRCAYALSKAYAGDYASAFTLLNELARTVDSFKGYLQTMLWDFLGRCYLDLEAYAQADEALSRAMDAAQRHQISWSQASVRGHWALAQIKLGKLEGEAFLVETLTHSQELGDLVNLPHLYRALGELTLARGEVAKAQTWAERTYQEAQRLGHLPQKTKAAVLLARIKLLQGEAEAATTLLENTLEEVLHIKSPRLMWDLHQTLADAYERQGNEAKASHQRKRWRAVLEDVAENLEDSPLKESLLAKLPTLGEAQILSIPLRLLVITDSFGTLVQNAISEHQEAIARCDAVISLGDLPAQAYAKLREDFALPMVGLCVLGNHDATSFDSWLPRYRFNHLHMALTTLRLGGRDIRFAGFSGSEKYKSGDEWQWDEREAERLLKRLPACDILLSHTAPEPPPNYHADNRHRGLPALGDYLRKHRPPVALHGHFHQNYTRPYAGTTLIGCYGAVLVQCMIASTGWTVEVQPLARM